VLRLTFCPLDSRGWRRTMRHAGRIAKVSRSQSEATWTLAFFGAIIGLAAVLACFGVSPQMPSSDIGAASQPMPTDIGAPSQPMPSDDAAGSAWRRRAEAAEANSASLTSRAEAAEANSTSLTSALAQAEGLRKEEVEKRKHLEVELAQAEAGGSAAGSERLKEVEETRASLEAARRALQAERARRGKAEAELQEVLHGSRGNASAAAKEEAEAREQLSKAEEENSDLRSKLKRARAELHKAGSGLRRADENATELQSNLSRLVASETQDEADISSYKDKLQGADSELDSTKSELDSTKSELRELEYSGKVAMPSPVVKYFRAWQRQKILALLAGVLGVVAIVGPSTYVQFFLTVVGSTAAGLMVSSCLVFLSMAWHGGGEGFSWIDILVIELDGNGSRMENWLCLVVFMLGILRWALGVECSLFDIVDDVALTDPDDAGSDHESDLERPLLAAAPPEMPALNAPKKKPWSSLVMHRPPLADALSETPTDNDPKKKPETPTVNDPTKKRKVQEIAALASDEV